jgi:AbrB family looped-hinge helix DNA binding protein
MDTSQVTTKGQLVIPARIRRKFGIKPGTKVRFIERGDEILLQPITKTYVNSVCGIVKSDHCITQTLLEVLRGQESKVEKRSTR